MNRFEKCDCELLYLEYKTEGYYKCSGCGLYYPRKCFYTTNIKNRSTGLKGLCIKCDHKDRTKRNNKQVN